MDDGSRNKADGELETVAGFVKTKIDVVELGAGAGVDVVVVAFVVSFKGDNNN